MAQRELDENEDDDSDTGESENQLALSSSFYSWLPFEDLQWGCSKKMFSQNPRYTSDLIAAVEELALVLE